MVGLDADYFRVEGDYATFIQTHLMPPLTSVRGGEGAGAPAVRERGREAKATRTHGRRDSQTRQRAGWPKLPTSLTCWGRSGETYQIPIEPAPVSHELVGVRGSIPASIEYTEQALELATSLMGMVQTSMNLLSLYRIPITSLSLHFMSSNFLLIH
ncbi:uncharacterized protein LOC114277057 [Camellia sinensis]|uniref:uncharacterized protein LOC114277057 n=1 Tax=Camellia sinensis TaxID=4442 RepID=UPI001035AC09|nr:uncharacterized protein LOC114277057 [Camellia sinensis]